MSGGHGESGGRIVSKLYWGVAAAGTVFMLVPGTIYAGFHILATQHASYTMFVNDLVAWPPSHWFTYFVAGMFALFLILLITNLL